jgi:hypothetical protein
MLQLLTLPNPSIGNQVYERNAFISDRCDIFYSLFAWLISHQPAVLFSQNKQATNNQPTVLFSQNKPAPAISHQPTEQAASLSKWKLNIALKFCLEMWSLVEQQALYHTINEAGRSKCAPNSFRHKEAK